MSEQAEIAPAEQQAAEETPQETPAAEETPAKTEEGGEQAEAKPEDTPAKEGEGAAAAEEPKKKEEPSEAAPPPKPAPEYNVVKSGFVQRQGLLWKKWNRQWMTLDEEGAALRWYRDETRAGNDGTLYMNVCADVCDPKEGVTTNWPEGTADCCFVVCSPNRAFYLVAETAAEKDDWVAKLTEAKNKFNTKGAKVISLDLFSVEAIKVALAGEADRAQAETDKTLAEHGTSTEEVGKSLDKAAEDAESELKKDEVAQQVVKETEQAAQQAEAEINREGKEGAAVEVTVQAEVEGQKEQTPAEEGERKEE